MIARFINKAVTWNPNYPVDINALSWWYFIFKDENWYELSQNFLSWFIKRKLGINPLEKMINNISNPLPTE